MASFESKNESYGDERIVGAAIRYGGKVFSGASHMLALLELQKLHPDFGDEEIDAMKESGDSEGFLTNEGRWVDRKEALKIAHRAGQIDEAVLSQKQELRSEDLHV